MPKTKPVRKVETQIPVRVKSKIPPDLKMIWAYNVVRTSKGKIPITNTILIHNDKCVAERWEDKEYKYVVCILQNPVAIYI